VLQHGIPSGIGNDFFGNRKFILLTGVSDFISGYSRFKHFCSVVGIPFFLGKKDPPSVTKRSISRIQAISSRG
jgi:hypothetical protein